jgi:hypothetical protein
MIKFEATLPKLDTGTNKIVPETKTYEAMSLTELQNSGFTGDRLLMEINNFRTLKTREEHQGIINSYLKDEKVATRYTWLTDLANGNFKTEPITTVYDYELKKIIQQNEIVKTVRSDKDSIADIAKWNSILTTMVGILYSALPEESLASIEPEKRALIETALSKFAVTDTTADIQFKESGLLVIDRILEREAAIGLIVKNVNEGEL